MRNRKIVKNVNRKVTFIINNNTFYVISVLINSLIRKLINFYNRN